MKSTKQVLVVRKDLKMRKGKIAAQCAHASLSVFLDRLNAKVEGNKLVGSLEADVGSPMENWLQGSFTKICVYVESEKDLLDTYERAKSAGIPCSLIQDNGRTEFHGTKTYTVIAIGPDWVETVDTITAGLPLL